MGFGEDEEEDARRIFQRDDPPVRTAEQDEYDQNLYGRMEGIADFGGDTGWGGGGYGPAYVPVRTDAQDVYNQYRYGRMAEQDLSDLGPEPRRGEDPEALKHRAALAFVAANGRAAEDELLQRKNDGLLSFGESRLAAEVAQARQEEQDQHTVKGLASGKFVLNRFNQNDLDKIDAAESAIENSPYYSRADKDALRAQMQEDRTRIRRSATPPTPESIPRSQLGRKMALIQQLPPSERNKPWQYDLESQTLQIARGYQEPDNGEAHVAKLMDSWLQHTDKEREAALTSGTPYSEEDASDRFVRAYRTALDMTQVGRGKNPKLSPPLPVASTLEEIRKLKPGDRYVQETGGQIFTRKQSHEEFRAAQSVKGSRETYDARLRAHLGDNYERDKNLPWVFPPPQPLFGKNHEPLLDSRGRWVFGPPPEPHIAAGFAGAMGEQREEKRQEHALEKIAAQQAATALSKWEIEAKRIRPIHEKAVKAEAAEGSLTVPYQGTGLGGTGLWASSTPQPPTPVQMAKMVEDRIVAEIGARPAPREASAGAPKRYATGKTVKDARASGELKKGMPYIGPDGKGYLEQ